MCDPEELIIRQLDISLSAQKRWWKRWWEYVLLGKPRGVDSWNNRSNSILKDEVIDGEEKIDRDKNLPKITSRIINTAKPTISKKLLGSIWARYKLDLENLVKY